MIGPQDVHGAGRRGWAWAYLGSSGARFAALEGVFGLAGRIEVGSLVNAAADEFRAELLGFDAALRVRDELLWQCTDLADRNPFTSAFLYSCCVYLAADRLIDGAAGDLALVFDDPLVARLVARRARARGVAVTFERPALARPAAVAGQLARTGWHRVRGVLGARARPCTPPPAPLDVLLVTWADPETFPAGQPKDHDTYYGELPGLLRGRGLSVGWIAVPAWWVYPVAEIHANIAAAHDWVLDAGTCRTRRDAAAFALRSLRPAAKLRGSLTVGGVDIAPLVRRELRLELTKPRQGWAHGFASVGAALQRAGMAPRVVVHPFENQPWEKALRAGIRRHIPGTFVVGYVHTPVPRRWFSFFPSSRDLSRGELPDRVVTMGAAWTELLERAGYPAERLRTGAAFRYPDVLRRLAEPARDAAAVPQAVLIACSIGLWDSLELVGKTLDAFPEAGGPRVLVKLHPKTGVAPEALLDRLRASGRIVGPHVEIVHGGVAALVERAGVVLYTTTSVSFEAIAAGVPAVFVESDFWFDIDAGPLDLGLAAAARTPAEIRRVALELLAEAPAVRAERTARDRAAIEHAFAPVAPEAVSAFLDGPA